MEKLIDYLNEYAKGHFSAIKKELAKHGIETSEVEEYYDSPTWTIFATNTDTSITIDLTVMDEGGLIPKEYFPTGNIPSDQNEALGTNIAFSVWIDGEDIYDVIPYNYTPHCWLPVTDKEAMKDRMDKMFKVHTPEKIAKDIKEAV